MNKDFGFYVELHVTAFETVKAFYQHLGFTVVREDPVDGTNGYLVMQRDGKVLAFWPGNETAYKHRYFGSFPNEAPRGLGVEIVFWVEDLDLLYQKARNLECVVEELEDRPWGARDFRIADPFGYYIRFTEPLELAITPDYEKNPR